MSVLFKGILNQRGMSPLKDGDIIVWAINSESQSMTHNIQFCFKFSGFTTLGICPLLQASRLPPLNSYIAPVRSNITVIIVLGNVWAYMGNVGAHRWKSGSMQQQTIGEHLTFKTLKQPVIIVTMVKTLPSTRQEDEEKCDGKSSPLISIWHGPYS